MRWQAITERPLGRGVDFFEVSKQLLPPRTTTYVVVDFTASVLKETVDVGNAFAIGPG